MAGITSTDPRKKLIVARLRALSGCNKITNVKSEGDCYRGDCLAKRPGGRRTGFEFRGTFRVPKAEIDKNDESLTIGEVTP